MLRPALELAVDIARRDAAGSPPIDPPRRLRPFLGMRRLSSTALDAVRRAVDESPELRAAMAVSAPTEVDCGSRAAWLFVHRPEGWAEELATLEAAASDRSSRLEDAAEERAARRRLRAVEEELRSARAALDAASGLAARAPELEAAVAEERRGRVAAEAALEELRLRVGSIERERDAAHRRASAADKALDDALDTGGAAGAPVTPAGPDLAESRAALEAASAAIAAAAAALDAAAGSPAPDAPFWDRARPPERATPGPEPASRSARQAGRLPATLPPGVFDDDPAAADHLVRRPSAVLLVDGYNLSLRRWADLPLGEQRARLLDSLNALVARVGVEVEVVFDGEEGSGRRTQSSGGRRRAARVTFSADAVEADEVLLSRVASLPISHPVVVATDDRRVQREAAARGANVIGSAALFAVLGLGR